MVSNYNIYKEKAEKAIEYVFNTEYHRSLGIPMPIVDLLLADDPNYITGLYYITIDQTWQIHLNFGRPSISFKEFQDEVKVLTRHEIEHYMCCPFDVLTHLRMLKHIADVYKNEFKYLGIDINSCCGSIANQAADIIVDTVNFQRHPQETIAGEINWIKKGADISQCPRHGKLMFLTKEAIWQEDLEINESDEELKQIAYTLGKDFLEGGIDNKALFFNKAENYTRAFFKLYVKDKNDPPKGNCSGGQSGNANDQTSGENDSGSGNGQQSNGGSHSSTNIGSFGRPKDGDKNGSALVFADPDKIKQAIETFASETSVEDFVQILSMAGLGGLTEKDKEILWFSVQSAAMIPIEEYSNKGSKSNYMYPSTWKLGDSIDDIDLMLSYMTSSKLIPGITTKKWEKNANDVVGSDRKQRDLLLIVDTSGSMGNVRAEQSNMFQAILASFGIIDYFKSINGKVALISFSDRITANVNWTNDYDLVKNNLITDGDGGTKFPLRTVCDVLEQSRKELVTVIITDGEIGNGQETMEYFRDYLNENNRLYLFILGKRRATINYDSLKALGAKVYQAQTAHEFCEAVLSDLI